MPDEDSLIADDLTAEASQLATPPNSILTSNVLGSLTHELPLFQPFEADMYSSFELEENLPEEALDLAQKDLRDENNCEHQFNLGAGFGLCQYENTALPTPEQSQVQTIETPESTIHESSLQQPQIQHNHNNFSTEKMPHQQKIPSVFIKSEPISIDLDSDDDIVTIMPDEDSLMADDLTAEAPQLAIPPNSILTSNVLGSLTHELPLFQPFEAHMYSSFELEENLPEEALDPAQKDLRDENNCEQQFNLGAGFGLCQHENTALPTPEQIQVQTNGALESAIYKSSLQQPQIQHNHNNFSTEKMPQQRNMKKFPSVFIKSEPISIDLDSDDDIVIVDERSCSQKTSDEFLKDRNQQYKSPFIVIDDDDTDHIKSEKDSDEKRLKGKSQESQNEKASPERRKENLSHQELLRRQKVFLNPRRNPGGSLSQGENKFRSAPLSGNDGVPNQRPSSAEGNNTNTGSMQNGNQNEDDNGWMDNSDSDSTESEELKNLNQKRKALEKRRKDKVNWKFYDQCDLDRVLARIKQCKQRASLAKRRAENDNPSDVENDMFVSDKGDRGSQMGSGSCQNDGEHQSHDRATLYQDDEDEMFARATQEDYIRKAQQENAPKKRKGGHKKGTKMAKTAREVEERRRERDRETARKKKGPNPSYNSPSSVRTPSGRGKKNGKNGQKEKKSAKEKKVYKSRMCNNFGGSQDAVMRSLLDGLMNNDFIADRAAQKDYGIAPAISERTKDNQFKALMASVPDDYDTHRANTQKNDLKRASKRFGFGQVKGVKGMWKLKGMKSLLYHHQLLAADWMVGRELASRPPNGGLLADAMGLGKTIEILATMIGNPPEQRDLKNGIKSTLLVLPSSAIKQWMDEIRIHCENTTLPQLFHYKATKEVGVQLLGSFDVVLTSYAEVMRSYPWPKAEDIEKFSRKGEFAKWLERARETKGDLHKMNWYRVVLDEAHAIKNYMSRTSLACRALKGRYRWALSGTPIQNRLDELFPYFSFVKAPWANKFEEFKKHFCDPDADDANARISVTLAVIMLRRTIKDKILGRPIVDLPPIHPETKHIHFSKGERVLYRVLEDRFRDNLNRHFANGTAEKNYANFMVQLLRLRQCTAHPFLLESTIKDVLNLEDINRLKKELKVIEKQHKAPIYEQIEQWLQESAEERQAARERGETPDDKLPFGQSDFGTFFKMGKFLNNLDEKALMERVICTICGDLPRNALITECQHIFCKDCLHNDMHRQLAANDESDYTECPSCRKIFNDPKPYEDLNLRGDDSDDAASVRGTKNGSQKKSKNSGPCTDHSTWLRMCQNDRSRYVLPSAKTIAFKSQVLKWFQVAPNDKIIVFVQFHMMAKILGLICDAEKWGYVFFTGNMDTKQRHDAVGKFHKDSSIKIMIAGLKVGGQALNLTCANRVISTSLWFNHCVEQQAFGRVFRIGQAKETYVTRFVVRNSVDMRLLDMQADKVRKIDRAMGDTDSGRVAPLSMQDLASLFGCLREDDDGNLRVEADYEDEPDEADGGECYEYEMDGGDCEEI